MAAHTHYFHLTKKKEKTLIGRICAVFAVIMPLTTLPQIAELYTTKNAVGLSLSMWVLYALSCVPFFMFGIIYRHKQIIVLNALWFVVEIVMIVGILLYRHPQIVSLVH